MLAPTSDAGKGARQLPAFVIIAALFAFVAYLQLRAPLIHDASWYIHVARGLLAGKHLYTDFIEVNPPLGMWLLVPVVWLADTSTLPADTVYKTIILLISACSIAYVNRCLKFLEAPPATWRPFWLVAFAAAILLVPGADFGEREHLIILLFAPWLFLRLVKQRGMRVPAGEAIAVGSFAAFAILLKPQAVFAPLFLEAWLLWQSRQLWNAVSVENIAAGLAVAAYGASIAWLTPEFITQMLPLGRAAYLPFYGYPWEVQLFNARWFVLFILAAGTYVLRLDGVLRQIAIACLLAAMGFALSYAVQNKGFTYQAIPATVFAGLAVASVAAGLWNTESKSRIIAGILLALVAARIVLEPPIYQTSDAVFRAGMATHAPNAKSIFIASTRLSHGFPLVEEARLQWASRLPTQWLAPYVASKWRDGPLPDDAVVRLALDATVTDMITGQPEAIFVDQSSDQAYVPGGSFDYLKFWSNDQRFDEFWKAYRLAGNQQGFAVYVRK